MVIVRIIAVAFCGMLLAACASSPPPVTYLCPTPKHYSREVLHQLAAEVRAAPGDAIWPSFVADYKALSDANKACSG